MPRLDDVTLLITHYNRSRSLERLLRKFKELDCPVSEIVVSDDGSRPEHLEKVLALRDEHLFRLVTTPVNRGLGNNLNKGQDAVKTPYTLYVQEDFYPTPNFPPSFRDGLEMMKETPSLDYVKIYDDAGYPSRRPFKHGFSEMVFRLFRPGPAKFFAYSDHPHLRRSTFLEKFGRYAEGLSPIRGEKCMVMSFLQSKGRGLVRDENNLFIHENSDVEPSSEDYRKFFKIRRSMPRPIFNAIWTVKLTVQYLFVNYRR